MHSPYLDRLTKEQREALIVKLHQQGDGKCFICQERIELGVGDAPEIDHIVSLKRGGRDDESNFALTHKTCNASKQENPLEVARALAWLKKLQERVARDGNRKPVSLADVLQAVGGSKYAFSGKIRDNLFLYSFERVDGAVVKEAEIFTDQLSGEKTCFVQVPREYLYHDEVINPRGINNSIGKLVNEFYKGNPQLHLTLARIDDGKIKVFDGQHKAVAQILLGAKSICVRLFINPNVERLTETNAHAGSELRQIAFDKSVMRQLNDTLYHERITEYRRVRGLGDDDGNFSEKDLCNYFKGENVRKFITDAIKMAAERSPENRLAYYIDRDGKAKTNPISYNMFDKVLLSSFIDGKAILDSNLNYGLESGTNPRELEIEQVARLLGIIADKIYVGKFKPEVGIYRLEARIAKGNSPEISDDHIIAFRMGKEEIALAWVPYLRTGIITYFYNNGMAMQIKNTNLFQTKFPDQLWKNLENFITNLAALPFWKNKALATTIFSGKRPSEFWKEIFRTGKTPDGQQILPEPLDFVKMIN